MLTTATKAATVSNGSINSLKAEDQPIHAWYRFVLSYPPHLVRQYAHSFGLESDDILLDPFCGTGTTLVEAKKLGIPSVGCDAHPFAALVSRVKTNWNVDSAQLRRRLARLLKRCGELSTSQGLEALSFDALMLQEDGQFRNGETLLTDDEEKLLPTGFVSFRPLKRLLIIRNEIERQTKDEAEEVREFFSVALAQTIANGAGNFAFGPEIYRTKPKTDYDVLGHFARQADIMIRELSEVQVRSLQRTDSTVLLADARNIPELPEKVSAVITSPPYPNEKDYTRTTRVESILLRLISDRTQLRGTKASLLRSNTRNIFVDDRDGEEVREFKSIQKICGQIENRRIELGKTSGFERLYHKVVAHYFGGMRRHFRSLKPKLSNRAKLAYVVGDQFSFLMVPVPTAKLLAEVAASEGFKMIGCDLWRERVGTKVRNDAAGRTTVRIREEVLLLERK
jgi:DNA modification methylase